MKKNVLPLLLAATIFIHVADAQKLTPLFNGTDLSGWHVQNGGAVFKAQDGVIVGTAVGGTLNSFLVTDKSYGDFVLELEFKADSTINSGVQLRGTSDPAFKNGSVSGYQAEIDPTPGGWTGGIYESNRRGWLYPLNYNPAATGAYKPGEWNKMYIECIGNNIRTWVNGEPAAFVVDDMGHNGFIGLQLEINDASAAGAHVYFKNIQIQTENLKHKPWNKIYVLNTIPNNLSEQEKKNGTTLLWDGQTTNGWRGIYKKTFPDAGWEIKDGVLTIHSSNGQEEGLGGDIITDSEYAAFELDFDFKITPGANSGVKYFVKETYDSKGKSGIGLEYQVLDDSLHPDAKLGLNGDRTESSLYDLIPRNVEPEAFKPVGDWNHGRILVYRNKHVEHWLNGFKMLEYERGSIDFVNRIAISKYKIWPNFGLWPTGHILLQDHGNEVSYRSIKIKVL